MKTLAPTISLQEIQRTPCRIIPQGSNQPNLDLGHYGKNDPVIVLKGGRMGKVIDFKRCKSHDSQMQCVDIVWILIQKCQL